MDKDFRPTFGFSHSRSRVFDECARKFYLTYHLSPAGARWNAHGPARHAYVLKNLTTVAMALGQQIHSRAAEIAMAIRQFDYVPSVEELLNRSRNELNRIAVASRNREKFLRKPKTYPMYQHKYYSRELSNTQLLRLRSRLVKCTENLATSTVWRDVENAFPCDVLLFDARTAVEFEGIQLYAPPDLVWCNRPALSERGEWTILDWKTGSDEGVEEQLATYYLYLTLSGVLNEDDAVVGRVVCLEDGTDYTMDLGTNELASARQRILADCEKMRDLLVDRDVSRNQALPMEHFAIRPDTDECENCQFFELCENSIATNQYVGPL